MSVIFTIIVSPLFIGHIPLNAFAQSDFLDFSTNLFGGSTSTQDRDQFTNVVPNQTSGLSKFTNTEYGFEFEFPSTWEVLAPFSSGLNMEGIPIQVASIRSTMDDGIHDLLTISVLKPSRYLDTDAMEVRTSNLSPQEHAKIVTDLLPEHGFKVVRENPVTVAGMPAYRIEYTTYEYETEVFVVKPDGTLYKLEFGTPMLRAPESLPVFNKMVDSFKFVNASGRANESQSTLNNQTQISSLNNSSPQSSFNTPDENAAQDGFTNTLQPVSPIQQFNPDVGGSPLNNEENNNKNDGNVSSLNSQSQDKITLKLNSAEFKTIESSDHQAKILVDYETSDSSLSGGRINGILVISDPDGNEIKTVSYPNGFRITESGIIQFASTIDDKDIDTVNLDVHLTNIDKTEQISNSVSVTVSLDDDNEENEDNNSESDNEDSDNENDNN